MRRYLIKNSLRAKTKFSGKSTNTLSKKLTVAIHESCVHSYLQEEETRRALEVTHEKNIQHNSREKVENFFEAKSIELPGMKTDSKITGIMDQPLKCAYNSFKEQNPKTNVSFSSFAQKDLPILYHIQNLVWLVAFVNTVRMSI